MQPEKLTEVRSWLKKAASDLRGADIDLAASPPFIPRRREDSFL
jgi:hypothetical protein